MTHPFRLLAAIGMLLAASAAAPPDKITTEQLVTRLSTAIDKLQTLRCNVKATERMGSTLQQVRTQMKLTFGPQRIYLRNHKGIEVLWVEGQNDGDAWVYPNSFPYVTLSLDPNGSLMRKNQHHGILEAGYGVITDVIRTMPQRSDTYRRSFRYAGDTTVHNRPCYILRSDFPQFKYVNYTPEKPETPAKIADRFGCGEHRILERNKLSYGETVPAGRTLQVPNAYGRRTIICVDQKLMLPLVISVWDDRGLFESFEFQDVVANQPIPAAEFSKDYKDYKL
ncbi:LysM peptidoglycan-binding domain-containing protein [Hymenobacter koreensis]|uniref:DUF1571 domain-containing protein n=1 Tax=Hymenobacter koreensis TaxID=1084523 RepID=A0ABP8J596_9BACT